MLTCMCTAYEFGKRSGRFPVRLTEEAAAELSGLEGLSFLRPTLRAPVVDAGGRLEVMRWGFSWTGGCGLSARWRDCSRWRIRLTRW